MSIDQNEETIKESILEGLVSESSVLLSKVSKLCKFPEKNTTCKQRIKDLKSRKLGR